MNLTKENKMKRILSLVFAGLLFQATCVFAGVVQDWSAVPSGSAGTYADSTGSKIDFGYDAGPKGGEKALKITSTLVPSGYLGVWTTGTWDLSKAGSLKFMAKSTIPGDVQMAITDAYKVQYIAKFKVPSTDWTEVTLNLSSFAKDPYYTPPGAVTGNPMDLSKTGNLNFAPQMQGSSVVLIGPVETAGTASSSPAASVAPSSSAASSSASVGPGVQVLDCSVLDTKSAGTFQDSQGSTFTFTTKDNTNKPGQKYLAINYELKQGGYCGMWCRAGGTDWKGVNLASAKTLNLMIYSKEAVVLGLALKDATNNQYVAETPMTKGGKWETVSVSLSDFKLDPYY